MGSPHSQVLPLTRQEKSRHRAHLVKSIAGEKSALGEYLAMSSNQGTSEGQELLDVKEEACIEIHEKLKKSSKKTKNLEKNRRHVVQNNNPVKLKLGQKEREKAASTEPKTNHYYLRSKEISSEEDKEIKHCISTDK